MSNAVRREPRSDRPEPYASRVRSVLRTSIVFKRRVNLHAEKPCEPSRLPADVARLGGDRPLSAFYRTTIVREKNNRDAPQKLNTRVRSKSNNIRTPKNNTRARRRTIKYFLSDSVVTIFFLSWKCRIRFYGVGAAASSSSESGRRSDVYSRRRYT